MELAKRGLAVLPCHAVAVGGRKCGCGTKGCASPGKHPLTQNGVKDATSARKQVKRWWTEYPNANIAIATGTASGLIVLDVDGDSGRASLARLEAKVGKLRDTACVHTGKGLHLYFEIARDAQYRNSQSALGPGLDIRAEGGYAVAPPSRHESGGKYQWARELELIKPLPRRLAELLSERSRDTSRCLERTIPEGQRNLTLTRIAGAMRRFGCSQQTINVALTSENERCSPPLHEGEIEKIARSVSRYPSLESGFLPRPVGNIGFQGLAGEIVQEISPHTEADPSAMLVQILCAFGSAIGRSPHFQVEGDRHGCNLFVLSIGDTAKSRKGTTTGVIRKLFELADESWAKNCIGTGLSSGEGVIHSIRDPRGDDLGVSDKRLLIVESEFASTLSVLSRPQNTLSSILRAAWDGSALRVMRRNCPDCVTGPHISVIGHITREELLAKLSSTDMANGLLNRFVLTFQTRSKRLPFGGKLPEALTQELAAKLNSVIAFARSESEISLGKKAKLLWKDIYEELSHPEEPPHDKVLSRAEAQVLRIAMIFALLDGLAVIRTRHLHAAREVWRYCADSAKLVFASQRSSHDFSQRVLELVIAHPDGISRSDIQHALSNHVPSAVLGEILSRLRTEGRIDATTRATAGRPKEIWIPGESR